MLAFTNAMRQNASGTTAPPPQKRSLRADVTAVVIAVAGLLLAAFRVIGPAALIAFFGLAVFIERAHAGD